MSDDGEPRGTAGRPILDILRGRDATDCLVTVARLFGGTLLGTGGLVRAYGEAARLAIDATVWEEAVIRREGRVVTDYDLGSTLLRELSHLDGVDAAADWGGRVTISLTALEQSVPSVEICVRDVSRGTCRPEWRDEECFT